MKSIKKLLAIVITIALVVSCFAIVASAGAPSGTVKFIDNKVAIECECISSISKVVVNGTELTKNTDYTTEPDGESTIVYFTDSYTAKTLTKDLVNVKVYIDTDTYFEPENYFDYGDKVSRHYFVYKETRSAFNTKPYCGNFLNFLIGKGLVTINNEKTVCSHNGEEVFYLTNESVYPANVDMADHLISFEPTLADSIELDKIENLDFHYSDTIATTFGTDVTADLSKYEKGKSFKLDEDIIAEGVMTMAIEDLIFEGQLVCNTDDLYDRKETVVKDTSGKTLMTVQLDDYKWNITIADDVSIEDNIYYTYDDNGIECYRALIFENPKIKSGDNSSWQTDSNDNLVISSTANYADFMKACVDGKVIQKDKDYTVAEGSTVVTLNKSFLATLSTGKHTLDIVSKSGTATATFYIDTTAPTPTPEKEEEKIDTPAPTPTPEKEEEKIDTPAPTPTPEEEEEKIDTTAPTSTPEREEEKIADTADNSMIGAFVALGTIAAAGFVSLKKKHD